MVEKLEITDTKNMALFRKNRRKLCEFIRKKQRFLLEKIIFYEKYEVFS